MKNLQFFVICVVAVLVCHPALGSVIYSNDFQNTSDPLTQWSNKSTDTTPGSISHPSDRFLGQFGNGTTSLILNNLPSHSVIAVSFDLYIIRTWDGSNWGDIWEINVEGGDVLLHTTFSHSGLNSQNMFGQSYPGSYPEDTYPWGTGAIETDTLGYLYGDKPCDSVYRFPNQYYDFTFGHSADSVQINFSASNLQVLSDESWGLDNVTVTPEPATLLLVGLGGLGLLRRKRSKA